MTNEETVTLPRAEYLTLIERNSELEDSLAAIDADDGSRVPHDVADAIIRGRESHPRVPDPSWLDTARAL